VSAYDITILVIIIVFGIRSLMKGLIGEVMAVIGLVVAFLCARLFGQTVGDALFGGKNQWFAEAAGYLLVFLLVLVAAWGISLALKITLKKTPMRWVDKLGGFLFGAIKGAVIVSLFLLVFKGTEIGARRFNLNSPTKTFFQQSVLANAVPRYTVCLFMGDMKVCQELARPPAATPFKPVSAPAKPAVPVKKK
jgi:membrane protein required for colicin V production